MKTEKKLKEKEQEQQWSKGHAYVILTYHENWEWKGSCSTWKKLILTLFMCWEREREKERGSTLAIIMINKSHNTRLQGRPGEREAGWIFCLYIKTSTPDSRTKIPRACLYVWMRETKGPIYAPTTCMVSIGTMMGYEIRVYTYMGKNYTCETYYHICLKALFSHESKG